MRRFTITAILLVFFCVALQAKTLGKKIDDWDENATKPKYDKVRMMRAMPMAAAPMMKRTIGLATGGAKDQNNFIDNLVHGYLPKTDAISYEGVFYDHYFKTAQRQPCKALFCPTYEIASAPDLFTGEKRYFVSVGLDSGLDASKLHRKPLNLVVVLDISGSMGASFDRYYYDGKRPTKERKSKMRIATQSIAAMTKHLHDNDRFGVVLFDDAAYLAKPLRRVGDTDMEAIRRHILVLKPRGGTNWSAGYKQALALYKKVAKAGYENRIVFLTDAMPNRGELSKEGLLGLSRAAAKEGIYSTFIGIGVDFNPTLVAQISKVRGANYYSVHSSEAFAKRLDKAFLYMVTPLVYDLNMKLLSSDFKIDAIYGSPDTDISSGDLMRIRTLFASDSSEAGARGGIILLRLKRIGKGEKIRLKLHYTDAQGRRHSVDRQVSMRDAVVRNPYYQSSAIRKAILLSRYVTLMKNWLIDAHAQCNDRVNHPPVPLPMLKRRCMIYPPLRPEFGTLSQWERRSCPLRVSEGYRKLFAYFARHYQDEMQALKDKSLQREYKILRKLSKQHEARKRDDWQL